MAKKIIEITAETEAISSLLSKLQGRLDDLSPVMLAITGVMSDATERAFKNEADPVTGAKWPELADDTVTMRGGNAHPILQVTGQLAASVQPDYGKNYAEISTNKVYAAMHQFGGTTSPKSRIPNKPIQARPFLGLSPADEQDIMNIMGQFLDLD